MDDCNITSERFFRGGHNSLLPFVTYFVVNPMPSPTEKRRLVAAVYIALMSGIFAGAEARMGGFARKECVKSKPFPVEKLARLVAQQYGVTSMELLMWRHLDLALNIAHGGITLDNNPENLQRDHIFPRSTLEKAGTPDVETWHYANFHFLRAKDNLNKSDTPPHEWFKKPGDQPPYTPEDLGTAPPDVGLAPAGEVRRYAQGAHAENSPSSPHALWNDVFRVRCPVRVGWLGRISQDECALCLARPSRGDGGFRQTCRARGRRPRVRLQTEGRSG